MSNWRDISTAPFTPGQFGDGDDWLDWCLLGWFDDFGFMAVVGGMDAGIWLGRDDNRACFSIDRPPTHWAPLPTPPDPPQKGPDHDQ